MPTTLLTPVDKGTARPVGATLWRKQLLPLKKGFSPKQAAAFAKRAAAMHAKDAAKNAA